MIHPTSEVKTKFIGGRTQVWQYCVILEDAVIGEDVNICSHCFIENDVVIGNRVTVKSGVQIWDGIRIEDDVFIGPNVSFTNDKFPRSKQYKDATSTRIRSGASIGAGAVILPGISIGEHALIGAGAVVTKPIPPRAIAVGNPAKIVGYCDPSEAVANQATNASISDPIDQNSSYSLSRSAVKLPKFGDARGVLTVATAANEIPFDVKRLFIVNEVPTSSVRGEHAHYKCEQFLICVSGSCEVTLDNGTESKSFHLTDSQTGIYIPPLVWATQQGYSRDSVVVVLASHEYDEDDYIRDYDQFLSIISAM